MSEMGICNLPSRTSMPWLPSNGSALVRDTIRKNTCAGKATTTQWVGASVQMLRYKGGTRQELPRRHAKED